jgi:hypothetical protein
MIVVIPQLICCGITTEREIRCDHAAPGARTPRPVTTVTTVTTHDLSPRHCEPREFSFPLPRSCHRTESACLCTVTPFA